MSRYGKMMLLRSMKLMHYLLGVGVFALFWFADPEHHAAKEGMLEYLLFPAIYAVILILLLRIYNAYDLSFSGAGENAFSQSLSHVIAAGLIYALLVIARLRLVSPLPLVMIFVVQVILNICWCRFAGMLYHRLIPRKKTVVLCGRDDISGQIEDLKHHLQNHQIIGVVTCREKHLDAIIPWLKSCDAVFVLGVSSSVRNSIAKYCVAKGVECFSAPRIGDILMSGAQHLESFSIPIMRIARADITPEYRFLKRAMDILLSAVGLILASPVMLVTALAIRLTDGGPVFYSQIRLTKNGRQFRILKFRSMRMDAERDGVARLASQNDDRITPVGRLIRACRIDELPQLLNILKGDMSIVGPRPERPEIAEAYEEVLPEFALRLQVKAGLTGFAQIYGRYNTAPYEKLQMDLLYIGKMSLMLDLKLIFATVKILLQKESTTGVEQGSTTAIS